MGVLTNMFINIFTVSRSNSINAIPLDELTTRHNTGLPREDSAHARMALTGPIA